VSFLLPHDDVDGVVVVVVMTPYLTRGGGGGRHKLGNGEGSSIGPPGSSRGSDKRERERERGSQ